MLDSDTRNLAMRHTTISILKKSSVTSTTSQQERRVHVGARVGGAEQRVPLRDDVVAEHAVALVHHPGDQPRRARHAHAELAVVRHVQALVQRAGQDRLVLLHLHHPRLAAVLDRHLVRPRRLRGGDAQLRGGEPDAEVSGASWGRGREVEQRC